jgi:hypothetical protein
MRRLARWRGPDAKDRRAGGPVLRTVAATALLWLTAAYAQDARNFGIGSPGSFDFYVLALT